MEGIGSIDFLDVMAKSQLLLRASLKRLYLIVLKDEVAVGTQQVVCHQVGVVGRSEDLAIHVEQLLAHLKRESEMIESVEFVDENK